MKMSRPERRIDDLEREARKLRSALVKTEAKLTAAKEAEAQRKAELSAKRDAELNGRPYEPAQERLRDSEAGRRHIVEDVDRRRAAGESQSTACYHHGISAGTLHEWRGKLHRFGSTEDRRPGNSGRRKKQLVAEPSA